VVKRNELFGQSVVKRATVHTMVNCHKDRRSPQKILQ